VLSESRPCRETSPRTPRDAMVSIQWGCFVGRRIVHAWLRHLHRSPHSGRGYWNGVPEIYVDEQCVWADIRRAGGSKVIPRSVGLSSCRSPDNDPVAPPTSIAFPCSARRRARVRGTVAGSENEAAACRPDPQSANAGPQVCRRPSRISRDPRDCSTAPRISFCRCWRVGVHVDARRRRDRARCACPGESDADIPAWPRCADARLCDGPRPDAVGTLE
jgi:hypothetical protein